MKKRIHSLAVIMKLILYDMIKKEAYGKLFDLIDKFRANNYMFNLIKK
jgi:hypothetical protein